MNKLSVAGLSGVLALTGCSVNVSTGGNNTAEPVAAPTANTAAPAPAGDNSTADADAPTGQDFNIINKTGHIVKGLEVSASDKDSWGPNLLGADVMRDGEQGKVTIKHEAEDCLWDVRATYDDGDTTEMKGVDLCKVGEITLTAE